MRLTSILLAVGMLTVLVPAMPTAAAYAEGFALTIRESSQTLCLSWNDPLEVLGVEPSCATASLAGIIQSCTPNTPDSAYATCIVEITGTLEIGPFVGAAFTSDAGYIGEIWDPLDDPGTLYSTAKLVSIPNVPREGGTVGSSASLQVSFMGLKDIPSEEDPEPRKKTLEWVPVYQFPRDPSYNPLPPPPPMPPEGCTAASGSVSTSGVSLWAYSEDGGVNESFAAETPLATQSTGGVESKTHVDSAECSPETGGGS